MCHHWHACEVPQPRHPSGRHRFLSMATICHSDAFHTSSGAQITHCAYYYCICFANLNRPCLAALRWQEALEGPLVQSPHFPPNFGVLAGNAGWKLSLFVDTDFKEKESHCSRQPANSAPALCSVYFLSKARHMQDSAERFASPVCIQILHLVYLGRKIKLAHVHDTPRPASAWTTTSKTHCFNQLCQNLKYC